MIDFTEIESGEVFEEFAEFFLEQLGFSIQIKSAQGADGGKDLIVSEGFQSNVLQKIIPVRYLVSVKHFAKSEKSVGLPHENDLLDRIRRHNCNGFILFASTKVTQGLMDKLLDLEKRESIINTIYNGAAINKIVTEKINTSKMSNLFKNYFPKSYEKFIYLDLRSTQEFIAEGRKIIVQACSLVTDHLGGTKDRFYLKFKQHPDGEWQIFFHNIQGYEIKLSSLDIDGDGNDELLATVFCGAHSRRLYVFKYKDGQMINMAPKNGVFSDAPEIECLDNDNDGVYEIFCWQKNYEDLMKPTLDLYKLIDGRYQPQEIS